MRGEVKQPMDLGPDRRWTSACDLTLRQLVEEGMSVQEISELLNRRPETVAARLKVVLERPAPRRRDIDASELAWARRPRTGLGRVC